MPDSNSRQCRTWFSGATTNMVLWKHEFCTGCRKQRVCITTHYFAKILSFAGSLNKLENIWCSNSLCQTPRSTQTLWRQLEPCYCFLMSGSPQRPQIGTLLSELQIVLTRRWPRIYCCRTHW